MHTGVAAMHLFMDLAYKQIMIWVTQQSQSKQEDIAQMPIHYV